MPMGFHDASDVNTLLFWIRDRRGVSAEEVLNAGRRLAAQAAEQMPGGMRPDQFAVPVRPLPDNLDQWTRRIWSISQRDRMIINLAGELQDLVGEMRAAARLPELLD